MAEQINYLDTLYPQHTWTAMSLTESAETHLQPGHVVTELTDSRAFNQMETIAARQVDPDFNEDLSTFASKPAASQFAPKRGQLRHGCGIVIPPAADHIRLKKLMADGVISPDAMISLYFAAEVYFSGRPTGEILTQRATYYLRPEKSHGAGDRAVRVMPRTTMFTQQIAPDKLQEMTEEAHDRTYAVAAIALRHIFTPANS